MIPNEFVICSDFDDVMNNLLPTWLEWLNNQYDLRVKYENVIDWDLGKAYPMLTTSQICQPLHFEDFWKTVQPKEDAVEYISKLIQEGFPFYIVTSSYYKVLPIKFDECLFKHFPFFTHKNVIITYKKQMIDCNMMIDDAPFNLEGGKYIKVLMDAPHNKNSNNIEDFRVTCWKDIYKIVHELMNAD